MDTFCEQKEVNYLFCFIIDFLGLDAAKDGLSQNAPKRSLSQLGGSLSPRQNHCQDQFHVAWIVYTVMLSVTLSLRVYVKPPKP